MKASRVSRRFGILQAIAVRRDAGKPAKGIREVALIGETAGQSDIGDAQVPTGQENLSASDADVADICADRTTEVMAKLATDLDRMTSSAAREIREGQTAGSMRMEHLANAQQPGGSPAAPQGTSPHAG